MGCQLPKSLEKITYLKCGPVGFRKNKCIVCKKASPGWNKQTFICILNWCQCDRCDGWVHLSFCCLVRILRSCDSFICTLCKIVNGTKLKTVKSNHFKYVKMCSADYLLCLNIQVNLRIIRMKLMQFMDTLLLFFQYLCILPTPFLFNWVLQILIG